MCNTHCKLIAIESCKSAKVYWTVHWEYKLFFGQKVQKVKKSTNNLLYICLDR